MSKIKLVAEFNCHNHGAVSQARKDSAFSNSHPGVTLQDGGVTVVVDDQDRLDVYDLQEFASALIGMSHPFTITVE